MVISESDNPSVLLILPTIVPVPGDVFFCSDTSSNSFVECKSTGFWLVGEDAHDDQEQNMTTAIIVPVTNKYFFTGIVDSPFNVYKDVNNLQIVKVKLSHFSMMCQTQFDDLEIIFQTINRQGRLEPLPSSCPITNCFGKLPGVMNRYRIQYPTPCRMV